MSEDISKHTLMVLVVLTIVISLLGTWTVINEASNVNHYKTPAKAGTTEAQGRVAVTITEPQQPVVVTGKVTIEIV